MIGIWEALSFTSVGMLLLALLHAVLPAKVSRGYACDRKNRVLLYRINGFWVLVLVCVLFAFGWWFWTSQVANLYEVHEQLLQQQQQLQRLRLEAQAHSEKQEVVVEAATLQQEVKEMEQPAECDLGISLRTSEEDYSHQEVPIMIPHLSELEHFFFIVTIIFRALTLYPATNFWYCLHAANLLGLIMSLAFYVKGSRIPKELRDYRRRATTYDMIQKQNHVMPRRSGQRRTLKSPEAVQSALPDPISSNVEIPPSNFFVNFFIGREFNPRWRLFDYKMFCYLFGAVWLEYILLSIMAYTYDENGYITLRMWLYFAMMSWFILDYMLHEYIHLYTYDLFAEKVGFKIVWGCVCFYPFFYLVGAWPTSSIPGSEDIDLYSLEMWLCIVVFLCGWILSRGANNQKYQFKLNPEKNFLFGLVKPKCVLVYSKTTKTSTSLLCSGWWGFARHINYLGEILMAVGLSLPGCIGGHTWLPLLYPLYYVFLLVPREREDNRLCQQKYGKAWREYCRIVPYRIIPYVY